MKKKMLSRHSRRSSHFNMLATIGLVATILLIAVVAVVSTSLSYASSTSDGKNQILQHTLSYPTSSHPGNKNPNYQPPCVPAQPPITPANKVVRPDSLGITVPRSANITTVWSNAYGYESIIIDAGALADDPSQGLLIIWLQNTCTGKENRGVFLIPQKVGSLTLTSVTGNIVSFTFQSGKGTFDLQTHSFSL